MLGDPPTAEIGTPEWDAQVAASVAAQFAAQDLAWRQQFAPETIQTAGTQPASNDFLLFAGLGLAVWFLAKEKPKRRRR